MTTPTTVAGPRRAFVGVDARYPLITTLNVRMKRRRTNARAITAGDYVTLRGSQTLLPQFADLMSIVMARFLRCLRGDVRPARVDNDHPPCRVPAASRHRCRPQQRARFPTPQEHRVKISQTVTLRDACGTQSAAIVSVCVGCDPARRRGEEY